MYAVLYGRGDPSNFLDSDLNYMLYFIVGLTYVVYLAGAIKSYTMSNQHKENFKWYWVLAVALTLFFILLIVLNFLTTGATSPAEFAPSDDV